MGGYSSDTTSLVHHYRLLEKGLLEARQWMRARVAVSPVLGRQFEGGIRKDLAHKEKRDLAVVAGP